MTSKEAAPRRSRSLTRRQIVAAADRVPVAVVAADPVSAVGIETQLRRHGDLLVVDLVSITPAPAVVVVVADAVDADVAAELRRLTSSASGQLRAVVVATDLDDAAILSAVEAGAAAILRRRETDADRLADAVRKAASGQGALAPDLLGRLLEQVSRLQHHVLSPRGVLPNGFTQRELDVLRLLAEGSDTAEIAERLCYSERTVKNVIHDVTTRLQLKNRSHAVAFAVRQGLV
jgi:DNA-binding NarL/FixJ family response regulator